MDVKIYTVYAYIDDNWWEESFSYFVSSFIFFASRNCSAFLQLVAGSKETEIFHICFFVCCSGLCFDS